MFDFSAVLVLLVSGGVGVGAMFGANAAGVENSLGVGLLAGGAVAFFFSQQQANAGTRNSILFIPCWALGLAAAIAGGLTFAMGDTPQIIGKPEITPAQKKRLAGVEKVLRMHPLASSKVSGKMGEKAAERVRNLISGRSRLGEKARVYLEVDGNDAEHVSKAIAWIESAEADKKRKKSLQQMCSVVIQDMERQFPGARCKVAIRTRQKWVAQGWTEVRGHFRFEMTDWPPDF